MRVEVVRVVVIPGFEAMELLWVDEVAVEFGEGSAGQNSSP